MPWMKREKRNASSAMSSSHGPMTGSQYLPNAGTVHIMGVIAPPEQRAGQMHARRKSGWYVRHFHDPVSPRNDGLLNASPMCR